MPGVEKTVNADSLLYTVKSEQELQVKKKFDRLKMNPSMHELFFFLNVFLLTLK